MVQTLASSTDLLCPVSEFIKRVDQAAIGKLASNTTTPVSAAELLTDANVIAALRDASGIFESAASVGGRYSKEDIAVILAAANTNAQGMLFRIVADVAWAQLFERRPNKDIPTPASMERSLQWLDYLADGRRIFPFLESEEAGHIERIESSVDDIELRNGVVYQAQAYYGVRSDRNRGLLGRG